MDGLEFSHPILCCWSTQSSETRGVALADSICTCSRCLWTALPEQDCTHGLEGCWPVKVKAHDQRPHALRTVLEGWIPVWPVFVCLTQSTCSLSFLNLDFASLASEKWHLNGGLVCICCVRLSILMELGAGQNYFLCTVC